MAVILVQNEKTASGEFDHYQDETGKRYQFPSKYKNKILPGKFLSIIVGLEKRWKKKKSSRIFWLWGNR